MGHVLCIAEVASVLTHFSFIAVLAAGVFQYTAGGGFLFSERVEGRLSTTQYIHILKNALLLCAKEIFPDGDYIFQQDNHPGVYF